METRKNGLWVHYRLASAKSAFHRNILKCLGNCFQDVPEIAERCETCGISPQIRRLLSGVVFSFGIYIRLCEYSGLAQAARRHGDLW